MFIGEYKKNSTMSYSRIKSKLSFLFDLHQDMASNEHQYVTKMALCVTMKSLWGDFTTIFWIVEYL
jgi:hypothetical protein